jgi:hypothetical protein
MPTQTDEGTLLHGGAQTSLLGQLVAAAGVEYIRKMAAAPLITTLDESN